jgi:hypothetical protein
MGTMLTLAVLMWAPCSGDICLEKQAVPLEAFKRPVDCQVAAEWLRYRAAEEWAWCELWEGPAATLRGRMR